MTSIWAIADLHLAFGNPKKNMEVFGPVWKNYAERIETNWKAHIQEEDLVLIPGDISWAIDKETALIDLEWIDALPGTKVLLKGNHDYWWPSNKKLSAMLPPSLHFIHNNAFQWRGVAIGGSRLWDTEEYSFKEYVIFQDNPYEKPKEINLEQNQKIFQRELERLILSLKQLDEKAPLRIAMTHYPPISADLKDSQVSKILESYKIDACVFGHLHNIKKVAPLFGEKNQIRYLYTAADYLDFKPLLIYSNID